MTDGELAEVIALDTARAARANEERLALETFALLRTPAGRIQAVMELLDPRDEEGRPLPPMISRETARRMLDLPFPDDPEDRE